MKYIIDSADLEEIKEALALGACGITANPSMYLKNGQDFYQFLKICSDKNLPFLSGEVMGETLEKMREEVQKIQRINPDIVIKLNFSANALKLCQELRGTKTRTAVTLIFTVPQAVAAINAGANYLFPFIGRSDEYGLNGMELVTSVQQLIEKKKYPVSVVAASIKNLHQLEELAKAGLDYAAIPYDLYIKSLYHPMTEKSAEGFSRDWQQCISTI